MHNLNTAAPTGAAAPATFSVDIQSFLWHTVSEPLTDVPAGSRLSFLPVPKEEFPNQEKGIRMVLSFAKNLFIVGRISKVRSEDDTRDVLQIQTVERTVLVDYNEVNEIWRFTGHCYIPIE